ncbi:MAG TPA: hypothetical protein DDX37_07735 [Candidatus Omnitrophica bacterium]|nr:hypothetical protein [Candidatus Omnitrophota bacterium]
MLIVYTADTRLERIKDISRQADLVRSCAPNEIKEIIGKKAVLQISKKYPFLF